jgi:hypothetical protein
MKAGEGENGSKNVPHGTAGGGEVDFVSPKNDEGGARRIVFHVELGRKK